MDLYQRISHLSKFSLHLYSPIRLVEKFMVGHRTPSDQSIFKGLRKMRRYLKILWLHLDLLLHAFQEHRFKRYSKGTMRMSWRGIRTRMR